MATDIKKIVMGGATISVGDWVAAGAAGSLTAVGALKQGSELTMEKGHFEIETDDDPAPVAAVPTTLAVTLKAVLAETALETLQWLLSQPAANLTGVAPNKTLAVGALEEQYKQVQLVTKGIAGTLYTKATRTITFWRAVVMSVDPVKFSAKEGEQLFGVTFKFLADPTVAAADKIMEWADSGAA